MPTATPAPLRIGVIGLDHWYAAIPFARRVAAEPGVRLRALVDRDPDRVAHVAGLTGCERTSTEPAFILEDAEIDAIACFTSVDRNPDLVVAAARAGKHIVSVKPLATNLADADRVVEEVERAGVVFVPSESRHTSPLARRLSGLVDSGRLGELRAGTFAMHSTLPAAWPGAGEPGWWADPARTAGGAWIDHAVYQIDRISALFRSPVAAITGTTANLVHRELPLEDYGHAVLTLESGAVVTVEDTWIAPAGASSTRAHIVGSRGAVFHSTATGTLGVAEEGGAWTVETLPPDPSDTLDALLAAVNDAVAPGSTVRTARQTLATCLAFYDAARGAR